MTFLSQVRRDDMLFHVLIERKSSQGRTLFGTNLDAEQLEDRVVSRHRQGAPITLHGTSITAPELGAIRIWRTEESNPMTEHDLRLLGMTSQFSSGGMEDVTDEFIQGEPGWGLQTGTLNSDDAGPDPNSQDVFVVHGRNHEARDAMYAFLRAIGLNPIEWVEAMSDTGTSTPYIGQILDAAFRRAHAVVVLLTPDDEARLKRGFWNSDEPPIETGLRGQARPNVMFEAGMALARDEHRTVLVQLGDVKEFSDIAGRFIVRMDNSPEKRQDLATRLRTAGCPVHTQSTTSWFSAGDFESAVSGSDRPSEERVESNIPTPIVSLSHDARTMLNKAAATRAGEIRLVTMLDGDLYVIGGETLNEVGDGRSQAAWESALVELADSNLIEMVSLSGSEQLYKLNNAGWRAADMIAEDK